MSLLLDDYPPALITKHISRFFDQYNAQSVLRQLDEQRYHDLHQKLLHQPTRREKQLQAVSTDIAQIPD
jgi:secreted Zn-dependent insulinase-like peptidase